MKDKEYWRARVRKHWHKAADSTTSFNKTNAGYYPPHAYHVDVRKDGVYILHKDKAMRFVNYEG